MEEAYAHAVLKMAERGAEPGDLAKRLREALESRGRTALLPRIGRALRRIAERERRRTGTILVVARQKDALPAAREAGAPEAEVRVDEGLIGGWRLERAEELLDASWKKHLLSIYNRAVNG
ncbi:hypothetical protein COU20_03940 [Candidatus Kaiserbacteria bacterium CG10_big_fil_rev_8_21_14_0_10_59_10]|uniref:F-type ATPase subunit delta n=1 Tax=Candidatus Kaiserbacteria bacterium CG10_big_fil_rev_8_21_14_0_10_59_10 TaxID=1974612 RepID=A0A2H0U6U5_9BACT|nr:MAG: hypothetical protein COU20_03940 [Candidatus Kaiserbacteria bacterium CG10_big_fil_rev_8_21_14_0_10_59_10]